MYGPLPAGRWIALVIHFQTSKSVQVKGTPPTGYVVYTNIVYKVITLS